MPEAPLAVVEDFLNSTTQCRDRLRRANSAAEAIRAIEAPFYGYRVYEVAKEVAHNLISWFLSSQQPCKEALRRVKPSLRAATVAEKSSESAEKK